MDYIGRVNRAVDYVVENLAEPLCLDDVARAAGFSSYHFHRIFRGLMGETLGAFIKRVRLERALYLVSHRKGTTLTEIALACGFSSSSDFSRAFRAHYGVSPRQFDLERHRVSRREAMQASLAASGHPVIERLPSVENPDQFAVTVRRLPSRRVAYVRVYRPYEGDGVSQAVGRLLTWAETHGLADGQWLGYQWDDPEIVALADCRYDVGLEIPESVIVNDDVSVTSFPAGEVAEIEIKGAADLELRALHWLFLAWLPTSGYAPAHQPMFEAFNGQPFAHGVEYFELRIQLPIVDASIPL